MKIFKLFKEIQAIRDVLTLIFTQQIDLNHKLTTMQAQLDEIHSEPEYEEFEDEYQGDIKVAKDVYSEMCEWLEEDEIEFMGIT
tara:strand:+ start:212 stop:463 length:252 start_codon:yes stop_codon:yes gene_type:complete